MKKLFAILVCTLLIMSGCDTASNKNDRTDDNSSVENQNDLDNRSDMADFDYSLIVDREPNEGVGRIGFDHIGVSFVVPEKTGLGGLYFGYDSVTFALAGSRATLDKIEGTGIALDAIPEHMIEEGRTEALRRGDGEISMYSAHSGGFINTGSSLSGMEMSVLDTQFVLIGDTPAYYFEYLFELPYDPEESDYPQVAYVFHGYAFTYEGDTYCLTVMASLISSSLTAYYEEGSLIFRDHYLTDMQDVIMSLALYNGEAYEELDPDFNFSALFRHAGFLAESGGIFPDLDEPYYLINCYSTWAYDFGGRNETNGELQRVYYYDDDGEKTLTYPFRNIDFEDIERIEDIMPIAVTLESSGYEYLGDIMRTEEVTVNGIDMIKTFGAAKEQDGTWWNVWVAYSFMLEDIPCFIILETRNTNPVYASDELKKTDEYLEACWDISELYATTVIRTIRLMDGEESMFRYANTH